MVRERKHFAPCLRARPLCAIRRRRPRHLARRSRPRPRCSSQRLAGAGLRPRVDADDDREAGPQAAEFGGIVIKLNAHRHPLNDFGEIAGRILRRNDAELRAGGRRKAQHPAMERDVGQHIGHDRGRLAFADMGELALLEIGIDPETMGGTMASNVAPTVA